MLSTDDQEPFFRRLLIKAGLRPSYSDLYDESSDILALLADQDTDAIAQLSSLKKSVLERRGFQGSNSDTDPKDGVPEPDNNQGITDKPVTDEEPRTPSFRPETPPNELRAHILRTDRLRALPYQLMFGVLKRHPDFWNSVIAPSLRRANDYYRGTTEMAPRQAHPETQIVRKGMERVLAPILASVLQHPVSAELMRGAIKRASQLEALQTEREIRGGNNFVPSLVVGSGVHGINFANTRLANNPAVVPLIVDTSDTPGGQFATYGSRPRFRINSRNDQPDRLITRDEVGAGKFGSKNAVGTGIVGLPDIAGAVYPTNRQLADVLMVNGALGGARFLGGTEVVSVRELKNRQGGRVQVILENGETGQRYTVNTDELGIFSGVGEEIRLDEENPVAQKLRANGLIRTFTEFQRAQGDSTQRFPQRDYRGKTVLVVGSGNSGDVTVADLLGLEIDDPRVTTQLDRGDLNIIWAGQKARTKEEWCAQSRPRYSQIGLFFPRENNPDAYSAIAPVDNKVVGYSEIIDAQGNTKVRVRFAGGESRVVDEVIEVIGFKDGREKLFERFFDDVYDRTSQPSSLEGILNTSAQYDEPGGEYFVRRPDGRIVKFVVESRFNNIGEDREGRSFDNLNYRGYVLDNESEDFVGKPDPGEPPIIQSITFLNDPRDITESSQRIRAFLESYGSVERAILRIDSSPVFDELFGNVELDGLTLRLPVALTDRSDAGVIIGGPASGVSNSDPVREQFAKLVALNRANLVSILVNERLVTALAKRQASSTRVRPGMPNRLGSRKQETLVPIEPMKKKAQTDESTGFQVGVEHAMLAGDRTLPLELAGNEMVLQFLVGQALAGYEPHGDMNLRFHFVPQKTEKDGLVYDVRSNMQGGSNAGMMAMLGDMFGTPEMVMYLHSMAANNRSDGSVLLDIPLRKGGVDLGGVRMSYPKAEADRARRIAPLRSPRQRVP